MLHCHMRSKLSGGPLLSTSCHLVQSLECLRHFLGRYSVSVDTFHSRNLRKLKIQLLNEITPRVVINQISKNNFTALPRVIMAIASDGLLFQTFSKIHPKFKTPFYGTLIAGLLTGSLAAFFELSQLIDMMSIGTVSYEN